MKSCYVVMSEFSSPVAVCIPSPKAVFLSKKEAENFAKEHNDNPRTTNVYYVRKAEFNETPTK